MASKPTAKEQKTQSKSVVYQRMNFMYQAMQEAVKATPGSRALSKFYGRQLKSISQRAVSKVSARFKRRICKRCSVYLVPGETCTVRIRTVGKQRRINVTCKECDKTKRYPIKQGYKLWFES